MLLITCAQRDRKNKNRKQIRLSDEHERLNPFHHGWDRALPDCSMAGDKPVPRWFSATWDAGDAFIHPRIPNLLDLDLREAAVAGQPGNAGGGEEPLPSVVALHHGGRGGMPGGPACLQRNHRLVTFQGGNDEQGLPARFQRAHNLDQGAPARAPGDKGEHVGADDQIGAGPPAGRQGKNIGLRPYDVRLVGAAAAGKLFAGNKKGGRGGPPSGEN